MYNVNKILVVDKKIYSKQHICVSFGMVKSTTDRTILENMQYRHVLITKQCDKGYIPVIYTHCYMHHAIKLIRTREGEGYAIIIVDYTGRGTFFRPYVGVGILRL